MRQSLTKDDLNRYYTLSVTDEYEITTIYETIYPEDLPFYTGQMSDLLEHLFGNLRYRLEKFRESCERRGYAGLLGSYSKEVISEATRRDDWENIVGVMERPKTLAEIHEGMWEDA